MGDYWKTVIKSLCSFWKPGQKLEISGFFQADPDRGIRCMLCHWPLTAEVPQGPGLRNVYLLTNLTTGHSITVGAICSKNYLIALKNLEATIKSDSTEIDPLELEVPDLSEELAERTLDDENYYYYFLDDEWVPKVK